MSLKEKLIKVKEFIKRLDSDDKINKMIDKDLKKYSKEELDEIYSRDYNGFGILTVLFDCISLADEYFYIKIVIDKVLNNSQIEPVFSGIMLSVILVSLTGRTITDNEHEKAYDKLHVLSLRKDNEKEI